MNPKIFSGAKKGLAAIALLITSLLIHIPLVDTYYNYSFEPDTAPCVEVTRSFYFFFKNPSLANAPGTLTSYPNYSDGQFICAGLLANLIAPLCKAHVIHTDIRDSDNSLIIFSMRWSGVLFDAAAILFVFLIIVLLTDRVSIAFACSLLYYLFNIQLLPVDFTRTDHYTLFAGTWVMWASIRLFKYPAQTFNYVLAAIVAGLITATKINFPFYLLIMVAIMLILAFSRKIKGVHMLLFTIVFGVTFCFMYLRWLMYAENIIEVLKITLTVGEDWTRFWGTAHPFFYLWDQFFALGFSWKVVFFLFVFYGSYIYTLYNGLKSKNTFYILLCGVFAIQILVLMFSPKVGRYGIIIPVWASTFISLAFYSLYKKINSALITVFFLVLVLLPMFLYQMHNYIKYVSFSEQKHQSIAETRIAAAAFISNSAAPGSVIAVQHPPVSNPPVFDLPYSFNYDLLQFPFLYRAAFCAFMPPAIRDLKKNLNFLIVNDKEKNYQLFMMQHYNCDSAVAKQWQNFYDSLPVYFQQTKFVSSFENYGIKAYYVYSISDIPQSNCISNILGTSHIDNNKITLNWHYKYCLGAADYRFQIQIATDSAMHWLIYGSRDGHVSKYRTNSNPVKTSSTAPSFVPAALLQAYNNGQFKAVMGNLDLNEYRYQFEFLLTEVLINMAKQNINFGESLKYFLGKHDDGFKKIIAAIYQKQGNILKAHTDEYFRITGINVSKEQVIDNTEYTAEWQFKPPINCEPGQKLYWRVRAKDNENVLSNWSEINVIR
jgi:hypothetical protein